MENTVIITTFFARNLTTVMASRYLILDQDSGKETTEYPSRLHLHGLAGLPVRLLANVTMLYGRVCRDIRTLCRCAPTGYRTCRTLWPLSEAGCRHRRCRPPFAWTIHSKTYVLAVNLAHNRIQTADRSHEVRNVLSACHSGEGRQIRKRRATDLEPRRTFRPI